MKFLLLILATAIDGDTLDAEGLRLRLWGISAPELHEPTGPAAAAALGRLIDGRQLDCSDFRGTSFDRLVVRCRLPDGRDLGTVMVLQGWARDAPEYSGGAHAEAEDAAQAAGAGLWAPEWR